MTRDVPEDSESTREHQEGFDAFHKGKVPDDNPYRRGNPRTNWYVGFYAGRRENFLARLEAAQAAKEENTDASRSTDDT